MPTHCCTFELKDEAEVWRGKVGVTMCCVFMSFNSAALIFVSFVMCISHITGGSHLSWQKYERTPCMQTFATNEQMISETSKALNILYVHNGTYEPYLIHWLFPLQIAFKQADTKGKCWRLTSTFQFGFSISVCPNVISFSAEHCYELAMYLHFLIQKFPSWPEIFTLAERVMRHVEEEDPDFYAHLQLCSSRNAVFDPKVIKPDKTKHLQVTNTFIQNQSTVIKS